MLRLRQTCSRRGGNNPNGAVAMTDAKKALRRKITARLHTLRKAFGGYPAMQLYQSALGEPVDDQDPDDINPLGWDNNPDSPADID